MWALAASFAAMNAHADVVVIVSVRNPITHLTPRNVSNIFLGKVNEFPDGGKAVSIDQAEGSVIRNEFYSRVVNKTASQMTAYWAKAIFSGDSFPPQRLENAAAVVKFVASNPSAIGYVDKSDVNNEVKVILEP